MVEEWKSLDGIVECGTYYEVSNLGNIRSIDRYVTTKWENSKQFVKGRQLKQKINKGGYKVVILYENGKKKNYSAHRLVALAFIPNPNNLPEVNHKDECKINNNVSNLEWCTNYYNQNYGTHQERSAKSRKGQKGNVGIKNGMSKQVIALIINEDKTYSYLCEFESIRQAEIKLGISGISQFFKKGYSNVGGKYYFIKR